MIKYIYVPEDKDPAEYYEKANDLNVSQIVHGPSDLILDFIEDYTQPSVIEIPEFIGLAMPIKTFKQGSNIQIVFIDEWIKQNKYDSLDCRVYAVDIDKPSVMNLFKTLKMQYDQNYTFFAEFTSDNFGEFILEIVANYKEDKKILLREEIIVYKEYTDVLVEELNDFKFEV